MGRSSANAASADWKGAIAQYTPASRTRRAMSCVTCEPKSTISTLSCVAAAGEAGAIGAHVAIRSVMIGPISAPSVDANPGSESGLRAKDRCFEADAYTRREGSRNRRRDALRARAAG